MSEAAAGWVLRALAVYLAAGVAFAIPFALRWAGRLDPAAETGTPGFRLLILPGATLLWPWLLVKVLRARSSG